MEVFTKKESRPYFADSTLFLPNLHLLFCGVPISDAVDYLVKLLDHL